MTLRGSRRGENAVNYDDFAITFGYDRLGRLTVTVDSPAGQESCPVALPFGAEELAPRRAGLARRLRDLAAGEAVGKAGPSIDPRQAGEELFGALFCGKILRLYDRSLGRSAEHGDRGLRIRIEIDPAASGLDWLHEIPWELLGTAGAFLSLDRLTPVVRFLRVDRPARPAPLEGALRILVVASSPADLAPLDLSRERRQIEETWGRQAGVEVRFLAQAEAESLRHELLDWHPHVVHYMGHGGLAAEVGGALLFETADRRSVAVPGATLGRLFQLSSPPALVVLNACETARWAAGGEGREPFAGVATALVKSGLLAVVAMQFPISDRAALAFSRALYRRLAAGDPVDAAVTEGRLAILAEDSSSCEWVTPVLFLRVPYGQVVEIQAQAPPRIAEHVELFAPYIQEKTRGFVGRQFVFDAIGRFLADKPRGYFFVRGDPGLGKTALLARMADRDRCVRHFNIRLQNVTRAERFLTNVCAQLIAKYRLGHASLPPDADRSSTFLCDLLAKAADLAGGEKIVVLVDALDEADATGLAPGANLLCLPATLPEGVYFVATARHLDEDQLPLRIDCESDSLVLDPRSPDNLADVEAFLRGQLALPGVQRYLEAQRLAAEDCIRELIDRSEGNFMYLRCVVWEMESNPEWSRAIDQLPRGLPAYYQDHWQRMRAADERLWLDQKLPVLMALTVTRKAVPIARLALYSRVADRRIIRSVLRDFRPFLEVEDDGAGARRYRLYHPSFLEFIKKKEEIEKEHVSFREAHGRLRQAMEDRLVQRHQEKPGQD
jgi:hypothetical protein